MNAAEPDSGSGGGGELAARRCEACTPDTPPLSREQIEEHLRHMPGWERDGARIRRTYKFKNYFRTMAFVNAVAWIAHTENHHPDMNVSYNRCRVTYTTHAIGGLSENDFICAAKVDALFPDEGA